MTSYAEKFGFIEDVKLKHELIQCVPNDDYDSTGRWMLTVRDIEMSRVLTEVFDGVMVCTGTYQKPIIPEFANQHLFKGQVLHSTEYREPRDFYGKRVLVVGVGSSGTDIAVDVSNVCNVVSIFL